MYPTENKVYGKNPDGTELVRDVTIEEARKGTIVAVSEDSTRATVQVKIGQTVCYCGVTLDSEGKICEFIPKGTKVPTAKPSQVYIRDNPAFPEELEKPPE